MPEVTVERLLQNAASAEPAREAASSRLKSRIFSAMQLEQQESGPLLSLAATHAAGRKLCVFEELVRIVPIGEAAKQKNPCRICHARVLGELVENAPIYWPGCPYVGFQDR
jgi:hypothetical protein